MPTRRALLAAAPALLGAAALPLRAETRPAPGKPFRLALNTSTIRRAVGQWGQARPVAESIEIAKKAGYDGIELWLSEIDEFTKSGGTHAELKKRVADAGLVVPNVIGFAEWVVNDPDRRRKGLDQAKRDFAAAAAVGSPTLAAPPTGATGGTSRRDDPKFTDAVPDPAEVAARYRALFDAGRDAGVRPQLEIWGFSKTLTKLSDAWHAAADSAVEGALILPDVYHLYKGGSPFAGLKLVSGSAVGIVHVNDYPALDRAKIQDADRVFPGDGAAPLADVVKALRGVGYGGFLSLELFNAGYWKRDPLVVATEGREKLARLAA